MTTSIKVTALRKALNEALEGIDAKVTRGSLSYDKETGEVKLVVDSGKGVKAEPKATATSSDSGDAAKDKFLNIVARLELDKKVRRWYNRNITDVNGEKWLITALSNKGDKFTLSPKDGEGRNKRVAFADIESVIAEGRTGRIDLGTKPKGNKTTSTSSSPKDKDGEAVDAISKLSATQVTELYETCLDKGIVEKAKRNNNKFRMEALVGSDKLTGRGSVMTYLKKLDGDSTPKAASKDKSVLTAKQKQKLELTLKPNFNSDRKRFAKQVNSKFSRVKFLTEYSMKDQVRVIVGFLIEEEKVRVYDPVTGKFRKVDADAVIRYLNK